MHEFILSAENSTGKNNYGSRLLKELEEQHTNARIYHTYAGCYDGPAITFVTTNKDLHLFLGTLSRTALTWLSEVLDDECRPDGVLEFSAILFSFPGRNGVTKNVLVTCIEEANGLSMHLSPAHT